MTTLYFVRHAHSPYVHGQEQVRGLSEEGQLAAGRLVKLLETYPIDKMVSSPYKRAIDTIEPIGLSKKLQIECHEALRERSIKDPSINLPWEEVKAGIKKSFEDRSFRMPNGESTDQAQQRAIPIINHLLDSEFEHIVIGTHGNIMTAILNYYDKKYDYEFWSDLQMPDIYRVTFKDKVLMEGAFIRYE